MDYIIKEDLYRVMKPTDLVDLEVTDFMVESCIKVSISEANGYVGHRFDLSVTDDITIITDLDDIDAVGTYCLLTYSEAGVFESIKFYVAFEDEEETLVSAEVADPRNMKLVECISISAIYSLHSSGAAREIPDVWVKRYRGVDSKVVSCDSALGWLRDMSKGEKTSENMTIKVDEDGVNMGERISVFVTDELDNYEFF